LTQADIATLSFDECLANLIDREEIDRHNATLSHGYDWRDYGRRLASRMSIIASRADWIGPCCAPLPPANG
jgi:hypothetical protein